MHPEVRRSLAVFFSLLMVTTASVGPALAGQVYERLTEEPVLSSGGGPPGDPGGNGTDGIPDDGSAGPSQGGSAPGGGPSTESPGGPAETPSTGADGNETDGIPTDTPDHGGPPSDTPGNGGPSSETPGDDGPPSDTPGDGGPSSETPGSGGPPGSWSTGDVELGPDASALEHRLAAYRLVATANVSGPGNSATVQRLRALRILNGTFDYVLDQRRATSARIFKDDMRVAAPLHRRAPNVTRHLVVSDRKLAETAMDDVRWTRAVLRARNVTFDETAVAENLSTAREAYDQGRSLPEEARHARIQHYRQAWTHAQRAIDVMDEAVEPVVTIHTRSDVPHRDTVVHDVNATVFDVRPWELETAIDVTNATANGSTNTTVPVEPNASTVPATVATVATSVNLTGQWPTDRHTYVLNLTVRDPGDDVADRGYDEEEAFDLHHPQTRGDPLKLDGDGLPDHYESRVTGTDPLDDDSDFPGSAADEAGNDTIDGGEDPDGEQLITFMEFTLGTEPLDPDTDADDLTDGFEVSFDRVDPLTADTDGDDVTDGREDFEGDGLSNAREEAAGTNPLAPDSDRDGLGDEPELDDRGTDPTAPDTDADGLEDPVELEVGTDPLDPDTDDDGVRDGDETFTTEKTDRETGVSVAATGESDAVEGVSVERAGTNATDAVRVGPVVRITAREDFENATVRIPVPDGAAALASNERLKTQGRTLRVFRWRPGENESWTPLPTTFENGTAVAEVASMGYFAVRAVGEWRTATTAEAEVDLALNAEPSASVTISSDEQFDDGSGGGGDDDSSGGLPDDCIETPGVIDPGGDCDVGTGPDDPTEVPSDTPSGPPTDGPGDDTPELPDDCIETRGVIDPGGDCDVGTGPGNDTSTDTPTPTPTPTPNGTDNESDEDPRASRVVEVPDAAVVTLHVETEPLPGPLEEDVVVTVDPEFGLPEQFSITGRVGEISLSEWRGQEVTIRYHPDRIDRFYVTADSDADGFPDSVERATRSDFVRLDRGTREQAAFSLDPDSADTDGDGLPDSREVILSWQFTGDFVSVSVLSADSNPSLRDTDGDGVPDGREVDGSYDVRLTRSADATRGFFEAITEATEGASTSTASGTAAVGGLSVGSGEVGTATTDLTDAMDLERGITSSPFVADTDDDDVSDRDERVAGTDADDRDTDGDGLSDARELSEGRLDPTLFDARPPTITVTEATFSSPAFSLTTTYLLSYEVEDASGVESTSILKGGTTRFQDEPAAEFIAYANVRFRTGPFEKVLDGLLGATVKVRAFDTHGNNRTVTGLERTNFYGEAAGKLGEDTIFGEQIAGTIGLLSGFTVGFGETLQSISSVLLDLVSLVEKLEQLLVLLENLGLVVEALEQLPAAIEQRQEVANPFDPDRNASFHSAFRKGWYAGYLSYFVVEELATGAVASVLGDSQRFASFVNKLDRGGVLRRGFGAYVRTGNRLDSPLVTGGLWLGKKISRGTDLPTSAGRQLLARTRSVGRQFDLRRVVGRLDGKIEDLSPSEQRTISRYIGATGEDGVDVFNRLDRNDVDDLVEFIRDCGLGSGSVADCRPEAYTRYARETVQYDGLDLFEELPDPVAHRLLTEVDPGTQRVLARSWKQLDDVDAADVRDIVNKYSRLDADDRRAFGRIVSGAEDEGAIKFVRALETDDLRAFLDARRVAEPEKLRTFISETGEVGADYVSTYDAATLRKTFRMDDHVEDSFSARLARRLSSTGEVNSIRDYVEDLTRLAESTTIDTIEPIVREAANAEGEEELSETMADVEWAGEQSVGDVEALGQSDISSDTTLGSIDVVTEEGGEEVGNEVFRSADETDAAEIQQIASAYEELVEEGVVDDYRIAFIRLPETSPLRDVMNDEDIPFTVLEE